MIEKNSNMSAFSISWKKRASSHQSQRLDLSIRWSVSKIFFGTNWFSARRCYLGSWARSSKHYIVSGSCQNPFSPAAKQLLVWVRVYVDHVVGTFAFLALVESVWSFRIFILLKLSMFKKTPKNLNFLIYFKLKKNWIF